MSLDQMMREIWRLNALVNGLHEPCCLAESCLKQADELVCSARNWADEEERRFFFSELAAAADCLSRTASGLRTLENKLTVLMPGEGSGQSGE